MEIRKKGLIDTKTLYDSVRISSATGDLNKLYITINAMYYYMFLDRGTATIARQYITQDALKSSLGVQFQQEAVDAYMAWMIENYPILDVGKIMIDNLKVEVKYNLFGDPDGAWNGTFD